MADANLEKLYFRGKEAFDRRNYDYAVELFQQILKLNPDHIDARRALRVSQIKKFDEIGYPGRLSLMPLTAKTETQLRMQKQADKVIEVCEAHLAKDPKNVRVRIALAQALQAIGSINGTIVEMEMARELQPDNVELLRTLGEAYTAQGKTAQAREALTRALQLAPQDRMIGKAINDLEATATMQKGYEAADYRGAMRDKDQAAHLEKDQQILKTEDEAAEAAGGMDAQIAAATTDREKVKLLRKKGEMLEKANDMAAAREAYQAALVINASDTTLKDKIEDLDIKRLEAAQQEAQAKAKPGDAAAAANLKKVRAEKLKVEIAAWERRVKDRPTDIGAHYELGRRFYQTGQVDKAIAEFQQTVKDPKRKVDSHLHLGMCFRHKNMCDLAATQFAKALETGGLSQERELQVRYEMAKTLEGAAKFPEALAEYKRIMEVDINYKDVTKRVEEMQKKLKV